MLRLAKHSNKLIEIDGPVSFSYVRDILEQATLFIRPLQKDITYEDAQQYTVSHFHFSIANVQQLLLYFPYLQDETNVVKEPVEVCKTCPISLPLSQLRKHILSCDQRYTIITINYYR